MASKIALRCHAQCPSNKVKHLTNLPSILERQNMLIIKYYSKIQPTGHEHDILKLTFAKDGILHSLTSIRSWKIFNKLVSSWKLDSPCYRHFLVPPGWKMSSPSVSLESIPLQKTNYLPIQIQTLFHEKMTSLYPDSLQTYTDDLVKGSKYRSASVIPSYSLNIKTKLPDNTSILTAEQKRL
jgi:hypothetical protein